MNHVAKTIVSAILAGFAIALGGIVFLAQENKVVGAVFFAVGLTVVCVWKLALFTGRVSYVRSKEALIDILLIWVGNVIGAVGTGLLIHVIKPEYAAKAAQMCQNKLAEGWTVIPLAMLCNVFIYFAVDNYKNSPHEIGKYLLIVFGVVAFILAGTEHCVANMFYFGAAGIFAPGYILLNSLGNAAGGLLIHWLCGLVKE